MVPGNPGPVTNWALPADGSFSTASNWTGNATPASPDTAIVNNGTTATLSGSSSVANLETGVGYSNSDGNVAVNGGDLSATGTIATGVDGTGTLAISNGGRTPQLSSARTPVPTAARQSMVPAQR